MTHDDHPLVRNAQPTTTTKASGEVALSGSVPPTNTGFSCSGDLYCVLLASQLICENIVKSWDLEHSKDESMTTVLGADASAEICSPVWGAGH